MIKNKLVLIFNDGDEVLDIPPYLLFNNILDAEQYLLATKHITSIKIEPDDKYFSFKTNSWSGSGKSYWVKDNC